MAETVRAAPTVVTDVALVEAWRLTAGESDSERLDTLCSDLGLNKTRARKRLKSLGVLGGADSEVRHYETKTVDYSIKNPVADTDPTIGMTATDYAEKVLDGEILLGKHGIAACKKHMDDLKRTDIRYDYELEERIMDFGRRMYILGRSHLSSSSFRGRYSW